MDLYDVTENFGTDAVPIAAVFADDAADAIGVIAGPAARILAARWLRPREYMLSRFRERRETAAGVVYEIRTVVARRRDEGDQEGRG